MPAASSTLKASLGNAMAQFGHLCALAAADATGLFNVIYGLSDGNDYGRYFYGQDPLVTFQDSASSLDELIDQGVSQRTAVAAAITAAIAASDDIDAFNSATSGLTEAVRVNCANPGDAVRLLSSLVEFTAAMGNPAVPADGLGQEIWLFTCYAVIRLRLAAAASLVRATRDYQPFSQQDAFSLADQVSDLLDGLATVCADLFMDNAATALDEARSKVVLDLFARGADLAPVEALTFGANLPAVVLAARLYDDPTREGDLLARNDPAHPLFVQQTIEALAA